MVKRMVGARHAGLEVAQQGVDPVQLRRLHALASPAGDMALVRSAHLAHLGKRGRPIAHHVAVARQVAPGPLRHDLVREVRHGREPHVQGLAIGAGLHGSDKGGLVGRLAPAVDVARPCSK